MIKSILVTGSSGTIGTRLCERLLEAGYKVYGVDKKPNKWQLAVQKITTVVDLRDSKATLEKLPAKVDLVIHLAANARVHDLVVDPSMAQDNITITGNVLEYARVRKVPRLFFSSSREVYGNTSRYVHKESDILVSQCESPYTASKISDEAMVWAYHRCYGLDIAIFRFSNVYGMYDDSNRLVPLFISRAKAGKDLVVYGKEKLLDFTYVDDTTEGLIRAIQRFERIKNDVYNLAYGRGSSLIDVARMIKKLLDSDSKVLLKKSRTGEVARYVADIRKARRVFGFKPKTNIAEGLRRSIDWYSEHSSA